MKSLVEFLLESNQLEDNKLKELLKPYNEKNFSNFNGQNVDLINYLNKNYSKDKLKNIDSLDPGAAFVKCSPESEYGGIHSITFGFINDDKTIDFVNFYMKTSKVLIESRKNFKNIKIDRYDECYYLDAFNLEGVQKLIK